VSREEKTKITYNYLTMVLVNVNKDSITQRDFANIIKNIISTEYNSKCTA